MITAAHPQAARVIAYLRANPGSTCEQIAASLYPPPPLGPWGSPRTPGASQARREAIAQREAHVRAARARVARLLSRLTEAKIVAPPAPARVARWYRALIGRLGRRAALCEALGMLALCGEPHSPIPAVRRELAAVAMRGGWSRDRTRDQAEARRRLVAAGVVEVPAQRRLVEAKCDP